MSLSIIVPAWNHWQTTANCLASIFKSKILIPYKVIVINDNSTDYTAKLLQTIGQEGYPITLLTNDENKGYLGSTNMALKIVNSTYILFLNNDVILDKNCIKELIEVYRQHPDIGILGATQLDVNRNELYPLKFFLRGEKATIRDHIIATNIPENLREADVAYCDDVHFACSLTTKEVIDKIGGQLDPDFGLGNYDQESACCAVKEQGYQIAVAPRAKFVHLCSVSVRDKISEYSLLLDKNRELFFKKWGQKLKENKI
jgi:GT2 family glycosyltransferase